MSFSKSSSAALALLLVASTAAAETERDRFGAGGYFRIMTRPDFQGGDSRLGYWNLYGRLLNEGPWAELELKLDLLQQKPGRNNIWTAVHAKIAGGSFANTDPRQGWLGAYGITEFYIEAGNVLIADVTWQVGTLYRFMGDLGLYDMRPADIFFDTVGVSGRWKTDTVELVLGVGDAGFFVRGANRAALEESTLFLGESEYNTIFTGGGYLRLHLADSFELGAGGQAYYEPEVRGNRYAPYQTPVVDSYEDYYRGEVAQTWVDENPGLEEQFPAPRPRDSFSYKLIGYIGFGGLGPLRWNNLFAHFLLRHPDNFVTETYAGREYDIYVKEQTDERHQLLIGNEMQLRLVPDHLDMVWAVLYGQQFDRDNTIAAGEDNRTFYSTVVRLQYYITPHVHILLESSVANEKSTNGNAFREHYDSIFTNDGGVTDTRGLEFGDTDTRITWQIKSGLVLNPLGPGIYTRPSLRLIYGLQYSNVHNAFGNSFAESLDQYNRFPERRDRHWHSVIAIEGEGWF